MSEHDLAAQTYERIIQHYGDDLNPAQLPPSHRTVLLVWNVHGILGNGGFQFLLEIDLPGDAEFLFVRQAYVTIGSQGACDAFDKAFAVFPKSIPPRDIPQRLKLWKSKYSLRDALTNDDAPDAMYFHAMDDVIACLTAYIQQHQQEFDGLG